MMMLDGFAQVIAVGQRANNFSANAWMHFHQIELIVSERPWLVQNSFRNRQLSDDMDASSVRKVRDLFRDKAQSARSSRNSGLSSLHAQRFRLHELRRREPMLQWLLAGPQLYFLCLQRLSVSE